ncbi:DEAD/DEAH box helicase family protein [Streptomyces sp. NPDC102381]|uniref:DEAD/DEAH box helicase family protein n=1 Tax=Streptomyces sp. NPDC102381 TaxID=3366164 RepID=UPI00382BE1E4
MEEWYRRRAEQDLVVKLNTGAGKTLVGLIMCQSSLNEGVGPALYLAPDPYLAEQAAQQAAELGLDVVTDRESPELCFLRSCKRAAGLRARHDCVPPVLDDNAVAFEGVGRLIRCVDIEVGTAGAGDLDPVLSS